MLDELLFGLSDDEEFLVAEFLDAIRAPQPIKGLTRQQSRLVLILQAARGRILSKPFLVDALARDMAAPSDLKLIDVMICQIRQRRPDLSPHIQTVWGHGVRWVMHPET